MEVDEDDFGGVDIPDSPPSWDPAEEGRGGEAKELLSRAVRERETERLASLLANIAQNESASAKKDTLRFITQTLLDSASQPCEFVLTLASNTIAFFSDLDCDELVALRRAAATLYEATANWKEAALLLEGIDVKMCYRSVPSTEAVHHLCRLAVLHLKSDSIAQAERAVNLCSPYLPRPFPLEYNDVWARIHEAKREFMKAALENIRLVQAADQGKGPLSKTAVEYLQDAATCALLAPAGPSRLRTLATLSKDERVSALSLSSLLQRAHQGRMLTEHDVSTMTSHMIARRGREGEGEVERERKGVESAFVEHNLYAMSAYYLNISFSQLALLLHVPPSQAEEIAARMIQEGRMSGHLDQVDEYLYFGERGEERERERERMGLEREKAKVTTTCSRVEDAAELILRVCGLPQ